MNGTSLILSVKFWNIPVVLSKECNISTSLIYPIILRPKARWWQCFNSHPGSILLLVGVALMGVVSKTTQRILKSQRPPILAGRILWNKCDSISVKVWRWIVSSTASHMLSMRLVCWHARDKYLKSRSARWLVKPSFCSLKLRRSCCRHLLVQSSRGQRLSNYCWETEAR